MANFKFIQIDKTLYNLKEFSKTYNLSYSTVRKYYRLGLRGDDLLAKAKLVTQSGLQVSEKHFNSKLAASKYLQIPKSTFYRKLKNGTLDLDLNA